MNFLNDLNESQRAAVECIDAPSLVIAGAGSGKTRVLTYKIAYLLAQGMKPWNILALTFTNKAANEMKQRIARQVGDELASGLWMGTFHSIFSRILRIECQSIGFTSDFTIYDATDQKSLVKSIIREMGLDDKTYKAGLVTNYISQAKNHLITPEQYANDVEIRKRDMSSKVPATAQIYTEYMKRCRLSNAMDFDDLLLYTYYLFFHHPEIAEKYEQRFEFVLVDEYQDTNFAQHRIVWLLTQHRQRVCVVGDDAQSIYSFRGANIENILTFQEAYNGAKLFKLEQNYRSTQNIVAAANSLIHHNMGQIHKDVFSRKAEGQLIQVFTTQSDYEESYVVSRTIQSLHGRDHVEYSDVAILYRTNAQSRSLEEALRKDGLPYCIYGGLSFYQRKEIKDVIAYLRLAVNPRDEEALKRVINYPARGIGDTTLRKVLECASQHAVSPWNVICDPVKYELGVNRGTVDKLTRFAMQIDSFANMARTTDASTLAFHIVRESGVANDINSGHEPDDVSRQENLQELVDGISSFVESRREEGASCLLTDYLQEVSLLSDLDEDKNTGDDSKITLMTIHSAKGLEFRVVFVVGLEDDLFPSQMAKEEGQKGLEEERRLMYVAMTRAEERLFLTHAKSRYRYGKTEMSSPSCFLREIDPRYLKVNSSSQPSSSTSSPFGSKRHSLFGDDDGPAIFGHSQRRPSSFSDSSSRSSSSSYSSSGASSSASSSSSAAASQFPPSVWGKTLRRVSSTSGSGASGQSSSYAQSASASQTAASISSTGVSASSTGASTGSTGASTGAQATMGASSGLAVGKHVEHARFGRGEVLALEGTGMDAKATVRFDNVGTKQLLLRFAKVQVID